MVSDSVAGMGVSNAASTVSVAAVEVLIGVGADLFSGTALVAMDAFSPVKVATRSDTVGEALSIGVIPGEQPALKEKSRPIRRKARTTGDTLDLDPTATITTFCSVKLRKLDSLTYPVSFPDASPKRGPSKCV